MSTSTPNHAWAKQVSFRLSFDDHQRLLAYIAAAEKNERLAAVAMEHEEILTKALGWFQHDSPTLERQAKEAAQALASALKDA